MKIVLSALLAAALAAGLSAFPAEAAQSKTKEAKPAPKSGEAFSGTGTVTKNDIDICMVAGLRYWLHPKSGEAVRIYPKAKHDSLVLDEAVKNKSSMHVTGTWKETVECHYVETSKVERLRK